MYDSLQHILLSSVKSTTQHIPDIEPETQEGFQKRRLSVRLQAHTKVLETKGTMHESIVEL